MSSDGQWAIVNDEGMFFGWVHACVDEFENVTHRGITWMRDEPLRWYASKRSALNAARRLRYLTIRRMAVVGPDRAFEIVA